MNLPPWPVRGLLWLLTGRLSDEWAEFVTGDLLEEFERRREHSRVRASVWLVKQVCWCACAPPPAHVSRWDSQTASAVGIVRGAPLCVREALRAFRARPLLAATCVAIIAIGVGSVTAVSAAVFSLLVRPLPLPGSVRLVTGFALRDGHDPFGTSLVEFDAFRSAGTAFEASGLARQQTSVLRVGQNVFPVQAAAVTSSYLDTVRVTPSIGRLISAGDDRPGAPDVVLISHAMWQARLAGRLDVLETPLSIDGRAATIIGVMPPGFDLPFAAEVWLPLRLASDALPLQQRLASAYSFIARLRPDVSIEQANAEAAAFERSLAEEYPARRGWTYRVIPLRQQLLGDLDGRTSRVIALVLAAVTCMLGICCVNVTNLLVLRDAARRHDAAVRLAIGASRRRLAVERLAENALIGVLGGGAGMLLAAWLAPALSALNPVRAMSFAPVLTDFRLDGTMLQIGAAVTLVVAAAVGFGPGVGVASGPVMPSLLSTGGPRAGISRSQRLRVRLLVVSQIAIAVVLLVAGGLLARSLEALRKADLGFEPRGLIAAGITLPDTDSDPARRAALLSRLTESIRSLPGVRSAGITTTIPLQHHSMDAVYTAEGRVPTDANDVPITAHRVVTPGYLQTLGVRVARGRLLSESDASPAPRVVVITSELARQAWPGQDPIGRRVRRGGPADTRPWLTVVGIVEDVKEDRFNFRIDRPAWYVPFAQEPGSGPLALVTRVEGEPADLAPAIRERVRQVGPDIAVSDFHSMEAHVADLLITERFAALLLTTLALSGLVLATLGLYGAISHVVAARQSEIALRMAVGAPRAHVIGMVMREVATIAVAGVTIGLILAGSAREVLATVLYGVGSGDGATYAAVTCIIVLASAVAALAPTIRAIRVDPAGLLRS